MLPEHLKLLKQFSPDYVPDTVNDRLTTFSMGETKKRLHKIYFLLFSIVINSHLFAQEKLIEFSDFYSQEIQRAGFTLNTEHNIVIEGAVISYRRNYHNYHFSSAWILDADSRELVWELCGNDRQREDPYISTFETEIELKPGTYEVYYST
jgi:hypothetical protein